MSTEHSLSVNTAGAACTCLPQPNGKKEVASRKGDTKKSPLLWREESRGARPLSFPRQDDETIAVQFCNMNGEVYLLNGVSIGKSTKTSPSGTTRGGVACTRISKSTNTHKNDSRGGLLK